VTTKLGLSGLRLADVLAELTATVTNEAVRLRSAPAAEKLSTMDYNLADGHLTGRLRLVLNMGRVGFSARDRESYAPEAGADSSCAGSPCTGARAVPFRRRARPALLLKELDAEQRAEFTARVAEVADPADYLWSPVHPWQADEQFLSGVLRDARVLTAIWAPTWNSYVRLRTAPSSAPGQWSIDDRTASVRVVGSGDSLRPEFRFAGADAQPHLVVAALLAADQAGIEERVGAAGRGKGTRQPVRYAVDSARRTDRK
jgi:hypothetical protein